MFFLQFIWTKTGLEDMNQDDSPESGSDSEIFDIKDPRPKTGKQSDEYNVQLSQPGKDDEVQVDETSHQDQITAMETSERCLNKLSKTKSKTKKKLSKRLSSDNCQDNSVIAKSSTSTHFMKTGDSASKLKSKSSKDGTPLKVKRKRKTAVQLKSETPNRNLQASETPANKIDNSKIKSSTRDSTVGNSTSHKSVSKNRKPNYDHTSRLSESKTCSHSTPGFSWFNTCTFEEDSTPAPTTDHETGTEPMDDSEKMNQDTHDLRSEENSSDQFVEEQTAVQFNGQVSSATMTRTRVRYTNLSLSMPTTREGRRKEEEDSKGGWLFECKKHLV